LDNPDEYYFLIPEVAAHYNPLQEGEFIACQTFPPLKKAWDGSCLQVASVVYRGFDYAEAKKAAELEDLGRDCSSAGVCQVVGGELVKLGYDGRPYGKLENPDYYNDDDDDNDGDDFDEFSYNEDFDYIQR
jgi:hypothetical protein